MKYKRIFLVILGVLLLLYIGLANILVSAALVPSFMERLEAFSRITQESVDALVHTDDIQQQYEKSWEETAQWAETAHGQKLTRETEDGYKLVAQEIYTEEESHKWVLLLHGYTGWKEAMYPFAMWYNQRGYHVIAPDMRCQGESEGDFIGMGLTDSEDNMLWINYILDQDPEAEIVIHGQSMGAACALMMTGREDLPENVKAVVSDCAYTDAYVMFQEKIVQWFHLPAFPILDTANLMLQLRGGYDLKDASALEAVKKSSTPTLFIHGDQDKFVPFYMLDKLYDAAKCKKEKLVIKGAGHAEAQEIDSQKYWHTVRKFIKRCALRLGNAICCPAVTFVTNNTPKEKFACDLKCNIDWYCWEKLSKKKGYFIFIPKKLMGHRIHEESTTTEIIGERIRTKEDYLMLCKFWPKKIAKFINKFYVKAENSNKSE